MSMIMERRSTALNQNVKNILNFLDREYPATFDIDEIEQDIETGYSDLSKELFNMYSALITLKKYNQTNIKKVKIINQYLNLLMKENRIH